MLFKKGKQITGNLQCSSQRQLQIWLYKYINGHKHSDVVKHRSLFVEWWKEYSQYFFVHNEDKQLCVPPQGFLSSSIIVGPSLAFPISISTLGIYFSTNMP